MVINKGSNNGVLENMAVITSGKSLVGKVSRVYDKFSEVSLITSKESNFSVKIQDQDLIIRAKGDGGRVVIDFIPREGGVNVGDRVVTVGLEIIYPENIFVGEIKSIRESDLASDIKADLGLSFNLQELENVFVILDY